MHPGAEIILKIRQHGIRDIRDINVILFDWSDIFFKFFDWLMKSAQNSLIWEACITDDTSKDIHQCHFLTANNLQSQSQVLFVVTFA